MALCEMKTCNEIVCSRRQDPWLHQITFCMRINEKEEAQKMLQTVIIADGR